MNIEKALMNRSGNICELCKNSTPLNVYEVSTSSSNNVDECIFICDKCKNQLDRKEELDTNYWQKILSETMWNEIPAIQVVSWRMLNRFRNESWAAESLDMMYLDDENLAWAKQTGDHENSGEVNLHRDCNGAVLVEGDTVVLTKSLDVKGSTLNAKLGTVVKNIRLVADNNDQIEGKIEGQTIIILTKYLRKK